MICVTIGRGRHSSLAEEWKAAAEAGVDLVELRLDCLRREPDLKRILAKRPTPWSSPSAGGPTAASGGATRRSGSRCSARRSRWGSTTSTSRWTSPPRSAGSARPSGSSATTTSRRSPPTSRTIAEQCDEIDADVVKIAVRGRHRSPTPRRSCKLGAKSPVPTIAIAMGEIGFFTRVLGRKFGAPFTYAGFNPERIFAPGMPDLPRPQARLRSTTRSTPRPRSTPSSATRSATASARRSTTRRSASSA